MSLFDALPVLLEQSKALHSKDSFFIALESVNFGEEKERTFENILSVKIEEDRAIYAIAKSINQWTTAPILDLNESLSVDLPIEEKRQLAQLLGIHEEEISGRKSDNNDHLFTFQFDEYTLISTQILCTVTEKLLLFVADKQVKEIESVLFPISLAGMIHIKIRKDGDLLQLRIYNLFGIECGRLEGISFSTENVTVSSPIVEDFFSNDSSMLSSSLSDDSYGSNEVNSEASAVIISCLMEMNFEVSTLSSTESFLSFGLDSLDLVDLGLRLGGKLGMEIPADVLDRDVTLETLSHFVNNFLPNTRKNGLAKDISNSPMARPNRWQKRILLAESLEPNLREQFNEPVLFKIDEEIRKLQSILLALTISNPNLRAFYSYNQKIFLSGTESYFLPSSLGIHELIRKRIDLSNELPIFWSMEEDQLNLVVHHVAVDGYSLQILLKQFQALLQGKTISIDRSIYFENVKVEESEDELQIVEKERIPSDFPLFKESPKTAQLIRRKFPICISMFLKQIRFVSNSTDYEIFLAAFSICMNKRMGIEEMTIGTAISVREERQLNSVDCLVSVVPLTISITDHSSSNLIKKISVELERIKKNIKSIGTGPIQFLLIMDKLAPPSGMELVEMAPAVCKYEQTWYFQKCRGEYELVVEFCSDLFREDTIRSQIDDLFLILRKMAHSPDSPVQTLDLSRKLKQPRRPRKDYPSKLIPDIFQLKKYPEMSWNFSGQNISFDRIHLQSLSFSWTLQQKYLQFYGEVPTSDRQIVLFLPRGLQMAIFALVSWNLGMAIVPISRDWPYQRVIQFVKLLHNPLLITEDIELKVFIQNENIALHMDSSYSNKKRCKNFWQRISNVSMGYLTCTSGSTGLPKAVCSSIRGLSNLSMNYTKIFSISSRSRIYQVVNYGFDIFFADLCKSLANGASMTFASESIPNWNELETCSNAYIMPAVLSSLPIEILLKLKSLESLQFGGERIQTTALERLLNTRIHLFQEFGLTEQCVYSSVLRLKIGIDSSLLGMAYNNLFLSVRDRLGGIIESNGSRGELFVEGFVARGYLGHKEENRKRFSEGQFRTRDEVIFYENELKFISRMDLQMKIAGRRIELKEIEAVLCSHKQVEAAVVTVSDEKILAHIISKADANELKKYLAKLLPGYMIPEKIISIKGFPLNANGKIDKKKLLRDEIKEEKLNEELSLPLNELEQTICQSMEKILGFEIGSKECFFKKGGNSVKAMLVIQMLQENGYNIKIKDFFEARTAEKVAYLFQKETIKEENVQKREEVKVLVDLSHVQRRLWFIQKLEPRKDCYSFHLHIEYHSNLSQEKMKKALLQVINQNVYLRSQIVEVEGVPFWKINPVISSLESSEFVAVIFQENTIHLKINHLVIDGRSLAILVEQIEMAIDGGSNQEATNELFIREDETDSNYWKSVLEGFELSNFLLRSSPAVSFHNKAARLSLKIPTRLFQKLCTKTEKHELFPTLFYSVAKTTRKIFDEEDIVIGTTVANRTLENYNCVGLFANTLPVRIRGKITKDSLAKQLQDVLENQNSSLEKIQQMAGGELIKCIVNYQNTSLNAFTLSFGRIILEETKTAQFPLSWIFSDEEEGITLTIEYDKDIFTEDHIETFGKWFLMELKQLAYEDPRIYRSREKIVDFPRRTIGQIVIEQSKISPNSTALETEKEMISYGAAFDFSLEVSYRLEQRIFVNSGRAPRPDDIIALCLEEGKELHIAINAVLLLGCAYTVIPKERKEQILQVCSPVLVVEETILLQGLTTSKPKRYFHKIGYMMYLMFTSGSTGNPKGVPIDYCGVANMLIHATKLYSFNSQARISQFTKSYFDASISNSFGAMTNGSVLCLLDRNKEATEAVSSLLPLNVLHMTPAVMDYLSEDKAIQNGVETWSVGGETPSLSVANRVQSGSRVVQLYGPTEATCYQTAHFMKSGDSVSCIGQPVLNLPNGLATWTRPLEESMDVGQFYCGGVQLSRGYLNEKDKNEKLFVENPFRSREDEVLARNSKIYLTGDRLYSDSNERLHFVGRKDEQIKISGYRIEIGEVEAALRKFEGVTAAIVVVQKDPINRNHLVAFTTGNGEICKTKLRSLLPAHMLPVKIIKLNDLPLTSNGKVDRKKLALRQDLRENEMESEASPKELEVLQIYQEFLNEKRLTIKSSLFHFGGNSLLAVRLAHRLEKLFGVRIPLVKLFSEDTPQKMARFLEGLESKTIEVNEVFLTTKPSQLQMSLLRMFRNNSFQQIYTNMTRIRLLKGISQTGLKRLFYEIMTFHPALRTIYKRKGKEISQEILDLTSSSEIFIDSKESLDVFKEFPIALQIMEDEIFLKTSHIAVDGHSMKVLIEDIETILAGGKLEGKDKLLEFNSYIDGYFERQKEFSTDFWNKKLSNFKLNTLLAEEHKKNPLSYESNSLTVRLDGLKEQLHKLANENRTTSFCVFLTLLSASLRGFVAEENEPISIAFPVNMRTEEFEKVVTMGVNLSLVLLPAIKCQTLLIQETARLVTEALAHPIIFNNLMNISSSQKLFEVMLTFDDYSTYKIKYFEVIREPEKFSKSEISIFAGGDEITIDYMKDLFKRETIQKLLFEMKRILTEWMRLQSKEVSDSPLSASQKQMFISSQSNIRILPFIMRRPSSIKIRRFHQILQLLVQKHESLRSIFVLNKDGEPCQRILSLTESYRLIKTGSYNRDSPPDSVQMDRNILEVLLTDNFIVLWLHHIVTDAWSTNLLEKDLKELLTKGIRELYRPRQSIRTLKNATKTYKIEKEYIQSLLSAGNFTKKSNSMTIFDEVFKVPKIKDNIFAKIISILSKCLISLNIGFPFANRNPKNSKIFGYFLNNLVINVNRNESENCILEKKNKAISQNIPFMELIDQIRKETNKNQHIFDVYLNCRYDLESMEEDDENILSMLPLSCEFPLEIDVDSFHQFDKIRIRAKEAYFLREDFSSLMQMFKKELEEKDELLSKIIEIVEKILKKKVDKNTNFFNAGGNSFQVIELAEEIEDFLGQEVNLDIFYQVSSLKEISLKLSKNSDVVKDAIQADASVPIKPLVPTIFQGKVKDFPRSSFQTVFGRLANSSQIIFKQPNKKEIYYSEFMRKVQQKAFALSQEVIKLTGMSTRPDDILPVISSKSVDAWSSCLTVQCLGAAYLPISSTTPIAIIKDILKRTNCHFYIGEDMNLEAVRLKLKESKNKIDVASVIGSNLAYVISTSGTTGAPKMVCIQHKGVINMAMEAVQDFFLNPQDVIYQFTSFYYDNSVLEVFSAIASSCRLFLDTFTFSPRRFVRQIVEERITLCLLFPGLVNQFKKEYFEAMKHLRYWVTGAEKLQSSLLKRAIDEGISVIQNYGPTETTCYCLTRKMKETDLATNLGKPIQNVLVKVDNGELFVAGEGRMRGYLNRSDSFVSENGKNWYRTGDFVEQTIDNSLIFIDRKDSQVKIRGQRVELGEIEEKILSLKGVEECRVRWNEPNLTAYCVTRLSEKNIKEHCESILPLHMRPGQIEILEQFPLTENLKVDFKQLEKETNLLLKIGKTLCAELSREKSLLEAGYCTYHAIQIQKNYENVTGNFVTLEELMTQPLGSIKPTLKMVSRVAQAWEKVLGHSNFNKQSNFLLSGGTSLHILRLKIELEKLGLSLTIPQLMENVVLANMEKLDVPRCVIVLSNPKLPIRTVVFVHSLYGGAAAYVHLTSLLEDGDTRILAIKHPNTFSFSTEEAAFFENLDSLTQCYSSELQEYLIGKVILCGFSIGGTLAVEIARRLLNRSTVIAVDTLAQPDLTKYTIEEHKKHLEKDFQFSNESVLVNSWDLLQMLKRHRWNEMDLPLVLLSVDGSDLGWKRFCPQLTVHPIKGPHSALLSPPNISNIAKIIQSLY